MDPHTEDTPYAVLFVDDEPQALKYFEKAYSKDFPILTAGTAEEARQVLDRESDRIGVLVADHRMPGETGVELLSEARRRYPGIVRILTTAYSELDNAIEAVNAGAVFRYVTKPWDIRDFRGVLLRAMEYFHVQRERDQLLSEKLHVLQRMIVLDRVRSLTVLAASLASRLRNPMSALKAFLDQAPARNERPAAGPEDENTDPWPLAQRENQQILDGVGELLRITGEPTTGFEDRIAIEDALRQEISALSVSPGDTTEAIPELSTEQQMPAIRADAEMIHRLLRILLTRLTSMPDPGRPRIQPEEAESIGGAPGIRLRLRCEGASWSDEDAASLFEAMDPARGETNHTGMDVLAAFFIAYHHGGALRLHTASPDAPGFELLLPLDPEAPERPQLDPAWLDHVYSNLEA